VMPLAQRNTCLASLIITIVQLQGTTHDAPRCMVIQSNGVVITITPHCGKGHSNGRYENRLPVGS
jgi:hypothetical protein